MYMATSYFTNTSASTWQSKTISNTQFLSIKASHNDESIHKSRSYNQLSQSAKSTHKGRRSKSRKKRRNKTTQHEYDGPSYNIQELRTKSIRKSQIFNQPIDMNSSRRSSIHPQRKSLSGQRRKSLRGRRETTDLNQGRKHGRRFTTLNACTMFCTTAFLQLVIVICLTSLIFLRSDTDTFFFNILESFGGVKFINFLCVYLFE